MLALIEPSQNDAQTINARKLERINQNIQNNSSLYQFEDLPPEFGLDEHFQIRYPVIEKKSNGGIGSTKEYFVHSSGLKDNIKENDVVTFDVEQGKKGLNAVNVKRV